MMAISQAKKPIVAAVDGVAAGIGTTMLLHCDLVYCSTNSKFLLPFVNLGLSPEAGSSFLLPLIAGHHRASELLMLCEVFGADKAKEVGLVNAVCTSDQLLETALQAARKLATKPPDSVQLTKSLLKKANANIVQATISEEAKLLMARLESPEAKAAFAGFLNRAK